MWHALRKKRHLDAGHALIKTKLPDGVEYSCSCGTTWIRRGR